MKEVKRYCAKCKKLICIFTGDSVFKDVTYVRRFHPRTLAWTCLDCNEPNVSAPKTKNEGGDLCTIQ